ncbi:HAD family hydrolase [Luteolibacter marinus]|uniref:HAD family hydrolase n=1 Tax=Luteolibacter marinus TaxID=2776705 RepID=UPI00186923A2|nr:HAD-IA family hydrolase [Luteolibacter marinus]
MLPGLIFDLDGTLVDSLPGIAASLNRALAALGFPGHEESAVRGFIGNGSLELARRALPDGADQAAAVEALFKDDYALTWASGTSPYPGIPECLNALHAAGHPLAVLSNKPHPFTAEIVARLFPGIPIDPVLGQRPEIPRKPHPEAALQIVRQWQRTPAQCCFIGDSTVDLATARAAGIPSLAVTWGYHDATDLRAAEPAFMVDSVAALATIPALS